MTKMKSSQVLTTVVLLLVLIEIGGQEEIAPCGLLGPIEIPLLLHAHHTHRWPWHAAIKHLVNGEPKYRCGGTVISLNSILTAAHCVSKRWEKMNRTVVTVSLGRLLLNANESNARDFKVRKIIIHPDYDYEHLKNDIAIVRISKGNRFDFYVQPICLWNSDKADISEVINKTGTVIGWGKTETGEASNELRQASLPVVSLRKCLENSVSAAEYFRSNHTFCAGILNGTSICDGDSGGSMTFKENGNYYIRGIMSSTQLVHDPVTRTYNCDSTKYVFFTDVAAFLPWIKDESDLEEENLSSCRNFCGRITDSNRICPEFDLGMEWSPAGPIDGKICTQVIEPRDPDTWMDNYICFNRDYGVRWSPAGTIAGMQCERIIEVAEPIEHTWHDNFLCVPYYSPFKFKWSPNGALADLCCVQVYEPRDIHTWHDNYLCVLR